MTSGSRAIRNFGATWRAADGRQIEIVVDAALTATRLTCLHQGSILQKESVELSENGQCFFPIPATNNLIKHGVVLLPEMVTPYGAVATLQFEIEEYIARYVNLSPGFMSIASAYVLLSWVYDAFNELPYLRFRGDYGSGKTRALLVIGSICNRPLFASGASTISPIFHALDLFQGTLIVDEADFRLSDERAELVKILNNGNVRGFPVLRSQLNQAKTFDPRAFYVFGPKLIAMRREFDDPALESRLLTEEMGQRPMPQHIPINLPDGQRDEARLLRNKLLAYRFDYLDKVAIDKSAYSPELSPRTNQILAPLLSVIEDLDVRAAIVKRMASREDLLRTERAQSPEGQVLGVVLRLLSEREDPYLPVSAIAEAFITEFGTQYSRPITPRYVGHLLRNRLGLRTFKRHGAFVLMAIEPEHLRLLGRRYAITD